MDNNINENQTTGSGVGTRIIFYVFGVFCLLLSLLVLVGIFKQWFGYDKEVVGTVTEINRLSSDNYNLVIEYNIDGEKKTKYLPVDVVPLRVLKNKTVKVKYSSKNMDTYFPDFENEAEGIKVFIITAIITAVCFMAPHNSKKALNTFGSLKRKVRR